MRFGRVMYVPSLFLNFELSKLLLAQEEHGDMARSGVCVCVCGG